MKLLILSAGLLCIISACNSQPSAYQQALEHKKAIESAPRPGTVATKTGSWTLTADINGKRWTALTILPPAAAGRLIGYRSNTEYISIPYSARNMIAGKKIRFRDEYAVDLTTSDYSGFWGGREGEMEITKVDGEWVEARFYFTATSQGTTGTKTVTNGFARFSIAK